MPDYPTATPGVLTSLNSGAYAATGGTGERILVDYKDAIMDYKVTDLPVMQYFAEPMTTDTGGNIDITFAQPSMKLEPIDEGSTPKYQHTCFVSEVHLQQIGGRFPGKEKRVRQDAWEYSCCTN